ncbi:cupin [Natronococcus pandeyae]|uniref:Cupin n=1 Tax=Natronococcus pandeyae TaxID=2055836 RepID=A0A8J8TNL6_9EURY|nr:cupin domain-containing protein [Natronococcus pandeyae]TYL36801.1 cupin [Natronococcus pandeyae]
MTDDTSENRTTTANTESIGGVLRRTVLKAGAVAAGALAVSTPATADEHNDEEEEDDDYDEEADVDEPDGFEVEVIAEHASFPDDVAATFEITYPDDDEEPVVVDLDDASTVVLAEATWEEGARSGWHRHPGTSIVRMLEGEIEHMMEDDCAPRTYSAGDAWIDPGYVHRADSEDGARAHATFLGIPDGEPATEWVEPVDC